MYPCCDNRWVVCISFADGETPAAAFPIKYYYRYLQKKGIEKEIYLNGLQKTFRLSQDSDSYRISTIPPEYGYNWEVITPDILKYSWYMLPEYQDQITHSLEDDVYYRVHNETLQVSKDKDTWEAV